MSVSNNRNSYMENVRILSQERKAYEVASLGAAGVRVLAPESAPIQLITATGACTVRLPLAALDGTIFEVVKTKASGAFAITVTDDAGSPATIATTQGTAATNSSIRAIKTGSNYTLLSEGGDGV